jgi:L-alanine-DL-glutamate epimerase-like enolase superfamily enzyme
MKITAVRMIHGGSPLPEPGFWPAWWPRQPIYEIGYSIAVIETDEGLTGFGPGSARFGSSGWSTEAFLREKVLGADPTNIGAFVGAPEYLRQQRQPPLAIEHALWDLLGKAAGLPVYKLLGGYRTEVPAYCSTGSILAPEEHVDQAWDAYQRGYRAIKLRLHRDALADDLAAVRAVREALPADMAIMADANQAQNYYWSRNTALEAARALQEMGALWLEEPLPPYDVEGLQELRRKVEIPVAGGENQYRAYSFRQLIERGQFDILQPDVNGCGGLLEWTRIAALCEAYLLPCIPHVWSNGLVLALALHAIGAVPNAPWAECTDDVLWPATIRDRLLTQPCQIEEGIIQIPQGPGWGVELDWEYVEAHTRVDRRIEE